jgi:hypothetical protein
LTVSGEGFHSREDFEMFELPGAGIATGAAPEIVRDGLGWD